MLEKLMDILILPALIKPENLLWNIFQLKTTKQPNKTYLSGQEEAKRFSHRYPF